MPAPAPPAAAPVRAKRPPRVGPDEAREWLTRSYGGFPCMSGRKHRYPEQHHEYRWVCLARRALDYQRVNVWCFRVGLPAPSRNPQFEYLLYHGRPEQIRRRATRNKHRAYLGAGKGQEVHHRDQKTLSLHSAVVVSSRAHDAIHSTTVKKKATKKKTASPTTGQKSTRAKNLPARRGQ